MNHDQTACLAVAGQYVAEDHLGAQCALRNLTRKRKRTDKSKESKKTPQQNFSECFENFTVAR